MKVKRYVVKQLGEVLSEQLGLEIDEKIKVEGDSQPFCHRKMSGV